MGLPHPLELSFDLSTPYFSFSDLGELSLVSRDIASIVSPLRFRCLKPLVLNALGSCSLLDTLLSSPQAWRHASSVRFATIELNRLTSLDGTDVPPEVIIARLLAGLPNLQHMRIQFKAAWQKLAPTLDFHPIAVAMSSLGRLCSVDIFGHCGGWKPAAPSLGSAGQHLRALGLTINSLQDVSTFSTLCSQGTQITELHLRGSVSHAAVGEIIAALPRPERLRVLSLELCSSGAAKGAKWWECSFWSLLDGLESLEVTNETYWKDYDSRRTLDELQNAKVPSMNKFLAQFPILASISIRAGPCPFVGISNPPAIHSVADAYDLGLLIAAAEELFTPQGAHLEDAGLATPEGLASVDRGRQTRFIKGEVNRVVSWAEQVREDIVREAQALSSERLGLELQWHPYEKGGKDDGDYAARFTLQRDVGVSGGLEHSGSCLEKIQPNFVRWL